MNKSYSTIIDLNHNVICTACGTQFPMTNNNEPETCAICLDDRQYIPETGQGWTNTNQLTVNHSVSIKETLKNLYELRLTPSFAIGQRAFLILSPIGNILWDCIPLLDEATVAFIKSKGGLKAIAFSHPHYYSNMNDWAAVFNCPIYIHQKDEPWIMNKGSNVTLWDGNEKELWDGITIIHTGGHFPGSCLLRIPALSHQGVVLCGDTLYISRNKVHIAVMHSYPNQIPLPLHEAQRVLAFVESIDFDMLYGAFDFQNLTTDVKQILRNSFNKYANT